jgi:SUF system NifU family Fe-S assembly protein
LKDKERQKTMDELRDLYQEVIFDHYQKPHNFHPLSDANRKAEGFNPLCGDRWTLYMKVEDGIIKDAGFQGSGCAISTASASLMTDYLKGKTEQEADALFQGFHKLVMRDSIMQDSIMQDSDVPAAGLGKLEVLSGVREFPARVKCATLPWHTMRAALANQGEPVSTE